MTTVTVCSLAASRTDEPIDAVTVKENPITVTDGGACDSCGGSGDG
jgi:hypothetical protein